MLNSLETQPSNLTTRISAVESQCKINGRRTPSHDKAYFANSAGKSVDDTLLIVLQKFHEQNRIIQWKMKNINLLHHMVGSHSRSIHLIDTLVSHVLPRSDQTKKWEILREITLKIGM